ncbi:type II toxin-antitoxin system prevent-host-death family antitoxin [Pseudoxanthomonas jiangsuensis]|uniref:type II toxin-antitoxin system Phd/YefM family antitoxin n=1 Tax=Pseudoxanthomonas jiangsuensis TaxID=619688 RepID=UPI0013914EED|nr:type II toxin-antitoxin system prevent-host-death family antitoxin [Pseudoxanthomonas jiangsuensis]KAF1697883.1 type II toxin-antitoxin system prevent-host-death family antitoxin [Pseudoxanthomonas jiangsuensis]
MTQVNMLEAKTRLSELVKAVQAGEEVVIANRGEPVARLVPVRQRGTGKVRQPGEAGEVVAWLRANPVPAHARRSMAQIDADIAVERDAWD